MATWATYAQKDLAATTDTDIYEVPASTQGLYRVRILNRTGAAITIRLWLALAGAATSDEMFELYEYSLPANDAIEVLMAGQATDVIRGRASAVDTSWVVKGLEKAL